MPAQASSSLLAGALLSAMWTPLAPLTHSSTSQLSTPADCGEEGLPLRPSVWGEQALPAVSSPLSPPLPPSWAGKSGIPPGLPPSPPSPLPTPCPLSWMVVLN